MESIYSIYISVFLVTCSSLSFFLLAVPTLFVNILFILLTGNSTLFNVANLPEYAKKDIRTQDHYKRKNINFNTCIGVIMFS